MKGLLIKDFNLLKKRGIFLLIVVVVYTVFQLGAFNSETAVGFATLMIAVFSLSTITYDEYENGMPFLFTLPIQRKDYVREKYVFGFLIATVTWIIMEVACILFDIFIWTDNSGDFWDKLAFCVAYLIVVYFIISLQIALKLKFAERSGYVIVIGATICGAYVPMFYLELWVMQYDLNWNAIVAAAVVVLFALMFAFYRWSVWIMEKREF